MKNGIAIWLFIILTFGSFVRLWQLGTIPLGLSDDEARYIYSSYSIWKTGTDVAGNFLPLSINLVNSFSPVYIYTDAPFVGLLGLSSFSGRLPYALISIIGIFFLYKLAMIVTKNKSIALLSAAVLSISPWHILLSRGAIDADFSLTFYIIGLYMFIKNVDKGNILSSIPFFLLGFYSYHGTKIFFIFLIPLLFLYYRKQLLLKKKQGALFLVASLCIIISFLIVIKTQNVTRQQVMFWNDGGAIKRTIENERRYNSAPNILKPIFSNKVLYSLRLFRENYLEAFSMQHLFLYGEPSSIKTQFSLLSRGEFYIIELFFLLIGIYLSVKDRKMRIILLLLLLAPFPSTFSNDRSYVNRSIMMLPFLSICIAYGVYEAYLSLQKYKKLIRYPVFSFGVLIYFFLICSFLYQYFFRYPFNGAEAWGRSYYDLAKYIEKNRNNYSKVYLDGAGSTFLLHYSIVNKIDPVTLRTAITTYPFSKINNVYFIDSCLSELQGENKLVQSIKNPSLLYPRTVLFIANGSCYPGATPSASIFDKGDSIRRLWNVY